MKYEYNEADNYEFSYITPHILTESELSLEERGYGLCIPNFYEVHGVVNFKYRNDWRYQFLYWFSDNPRPNEFWSYSKQKYVAYGAYNMTFRRLYKLLCDRFNAGEPFVNEYFRSCYPESYMQSQVEYALNKVVKFADELKEEERNTLVYRKDGGLDRRYKVNRATEIEHRRYGYRRARRHLEVSEAKELSDEIKDCIRYALQTGQIPLNRSNSENTLEKRADLQGVEAEYMFYASGALIDDLSLELRFTYDG